jgi:1-deoxy-D-xylulose-5-phosphate reductoisomerase
VQAFLDGKIRFPDIVRTVARAVGAAEQWRAEPETLQDVLAADSWARDFARTLVGN